MTPAGTLAAIVVAMAVLAAVEAAIPLRARSKAQRARLGTNLALTGVTFATNLVLNAALVGGLAWLQARELGLLNRLSLPPLVATAVVLIVLDFSFYAVHVAMHALPGLWRFHRVHHADRFVDVTTTLRQHPGEGVIRYVVMAAFAFALGASPAAFAIYRACSALNALPEHANVRVPAWLGWALSLVTTWPTMHKVHHSRRANETDTNYGNLFSVFDRLFGTFTPAARGVDVPYGLDGHDDPAAQTLPALLALPFRRERRPTTVRRRSA
jgi:sterol desaturase/sphingolipid hydroxylase (fatty acid hydroxylase superfamily)